jgi:glutathione S-transferase
MSVVLYHHPFSRAAGVVWALEEVGIDYELKFVDLFKGEHRAPEMLALNPMGKLPILVDGDEIVTEAAAIGLYLADRYAPGRLAPALDDPKRGTYLRWILFAPSVIEPGVMAKAAAWEFQETRAGWGNYERMLASIESAIGGGDYILGDQFSMADMVLGGTLSFMLMTGALEARPSFTAYVERLRARPAHQRADAKNAAVREEHGIQLPR